MRPDPTARPWYSVIGMLLSGCTAVYCAVELVRCIRGLRPILTRSFAVVLILAGLVTSYVCTEAGVRLRREWRTDRIPDLRLMPDSQGTATPTPNSP